MLFAAWQYPSLDESPGHLTYQTYHHLSCLVFDVFSSFGARSVKFHYCEMAAWPDVFCIIGQISIYEAMRPDNMALAIARDSV